MILISQHWASELYSKHGEVAYVSLECFQDVSRMFPGCFLIGFVVVIGMH